LYRFRRHARSDSLIAIFALAALASAFLLFWVEPLFARMVLPLLGGAPAVWNTCLMFFQSLLLLGYLYAHASARYLTTRRQIILHLTLLAICVVTLPVGIPDGWTPPASGNVIPWLLLALSVSVGAPFLVLSGTAPLLQRWLAEMDRPIENPYVLYAASNAGSFIGLLAFPLLFEPTLRLGQQSRMWTAIYVVAVILVGVSGAIALRRSTGAHRTVARIGEDDSRLAPWARARWVALAFVPSSLLLGITTFLSTDVAATPLLWVIPLSIYLLTFVIVFARSGRKVSTPAAVVHALLITTLILAFFWQASLGFKRGYALHLTTFAFTALVLHGELAASRPSTSRLTEYYLWISLGGALGGAFTALVVPLIFKSTRDYTLMLVLACFLRPTYLKKLRGHHIITALIPAILLFVVAKPDLDSIHLGPVSMMWVASIAAGAIVFYLSGNALRFGTAIAAIAIAGILVQQSRDTIFSDRSFFGIYRVTRNSGPTHILYHGSTIHGAEFLDSARRLEPITYYHRNGPVGAVFEKLQTGEPRRNVGIVGLGTGSILCYSKPGEHWTFFEIDPHVAAIAKNPSLFSFLSECAVKPDIVFGDARLTIAREPAGKYSMLVLDAFSSDAIPIHLLTREAFDLYRRVLNDDGILFVHISNRRLELEPVVGALARDAGLYAMVMDYDVAESKQESDYDYGSTWVVLAKRPGDLNPLVGDWRWRAVRAAPSRELWTDDYSNLLSVIKW
jgi:hypothetical protein